MSRAWLYTGEGLFAKTPSGQIEPSEKDIRDALKNVTMCLNNGVKMENVSKMLGHTNVRTTQQYAKVLNAEVEKDFEMLERILS